MSDVVRAVFEDIIMEMAMLLKPEALVVSKKGEWCKTRATGIHRKSGLMKTV